MYDIPLNPRMRKLCNSGQIADDFHNNILERKELLTRLDINFLRINAVEHQML